jgi:chemotaxis protein methyltransferase WspC
MSTLGSQRHGSAEELLRRWIGLDPATLGSATIQRSVRTRMAALGIADAEAYAELALQDEAERDKLVEEVVVAESWFFRDRQVFDFIRRFACMLASIPGRVPVRILSAPCAAGEEPYSVAMHLLDAGLAPTQFSIDAIDVSRASLERAERARYTANAFRNADLSFRDRWFHPEQGASVLDAQVRDCVRFAWGNLLEESFITGALAAGRGPYDIVFCRNLLIYLTPTARARVERAIERLLKPDGLLVLGAAEPPIMKGDWIPAGDSSVFALRRGTAEPARKAAAGRSPETTARTGGRPRKAGSPRPAAAAPAESGTGRGHLPEATAPANLTLDEVLHEAGAMANARRFSDAIAFCDEHMRRLGPAPAIFFLLGMLHQSAGDLDRAEGCFHKTLYLDAGHEEAILALALLAAQRGDAAMAAKYRQSATRILARKASS